MDKKRLYTVQATEGEIRNIGYNRAVRTMRKRIMVLVVVGGIMLVLAVINTVVGCVDEPLMVRVVSGLLLGLALVVLWFMYKCGKAAQAFAKDIKAGSQVKDKDRRGGLEGWM